MFITRVRRSGFGSNFGDVVGMFASLESNTENESFIQRPQQIPGLENVVVRLNRCVNSLRYVLVYRMRCITHKIIDMIFLPTNSFTISTGGLFLVLAMFGEFNNATNNKSLEKLGNRLNLNSREHFSSTTEKRQFQFSDFSREFFLLDWKKLRNWHVLNGRRSWVI